MAEVVTYVIATEDVMDMPLGKIVLRCGREHVDTSRLGSRGGLPYLSNHDTNMPLGRFVKVDANGRQVEGEAELVETQRNGPFLQEVRAGIRPGCSPAFLIDLNSIEAQEDPEDRDGYIAVINRWTIYEASAVTTPVGKNAGLVSLRDRSTRASIVPADIQEQVDREVERQVSAAQDTRDTWAAENAKLEAKILSTTHNTAGQNGKAAVTHQSDTGKATDTPGPSKRESYRAAFRSMLFGGPEPSGEGILDYVGQPGRLGTITLAFDTTTAHGAVTKMGGAMAADGFFEESPRRILALPRRIENIAGDQQIPTLTQEPNSAMVVQNGARLAAVDATLAAAPPTLSPKRLQTVVDYSMETTLVSPGFEDFIMGVMMSASDREMAAQILTGDGTGQNITGITATAGIKETEYQPTDYGSQASFFDGEDKLTVDVPADRRAWVLSEDLFRKARRTLRDPGSGDYVAREWAGQMRVLDNSMAIRTNTLPAGVGLYGEWTACVLGVWATMLVTVDRITQPGVLKITLDRYFDFQITRAARFSILKAA